MDFMHEENLKWLRWKRLQMRAKRLWKTLEDLIEEAADNATFAVDFDERPRR